MAEWVSLVLGVAFAVSILAVTGWWHFAFFPFTISAKRMTVRRLGLGVTDPTDIDRVDSVLARFIGGFNAMITKPTVSACQAYCDAQPVIYQPFAQEGVAMGYTLRHLFRYAPAAFEQRIVRKRPEYRYLHYVGLGFWSGIRNHSPQRIARIAEGLDSMHRFLCFDGYGFKIAFFDHGKDRDALKKLDLLDGYARNAAYQGVGRAFFFRFMDDSDELVRRVADLGDVAPDVAAGVGLAAVFVNPDRFDAAVRLAQSMPPDWRAHFHLGMCFACKARSINDLDEFEGNVSRLDPAAQEAVYASVRECDRVELQVRAEGSADGYRRWRESVTAWMANHIVYPLAGLKGTEKPAARLPGNVNVTEEV